MRFHHVGVVTMEDSLILSVLGLLGEVTLVGTKYVPEWSCVCNVYRLGNGEGLFETVRPIGPSSLYRWYAEHGTSLHHVALRVISIEATSELLLNRGVRLVSEKPVVGVLGWRVNFIHPSVCGLLIELVEEPR